MLKKQSVFLAISYSIVLAFVSLIQISLGEISTIVPSFGDKIFHFLAYSIFTWLWFKVFYSYYNYPKNKAIRFTIILALIFGIIIEVLQERTTQTRVFDCLDILANILGTFGAVLIIVFNIKGDVKKD